MKPGLSREVFITRAEAVTALGPDLDTLFDALTQKKSGIARVSRFDVTDAISPYAALIKTLPVDSDRSMIFELSDLLLEKAGVLEPDSLVITASTKAAIDLLESYKASNETLDPMVFPARLPDYLTGKLKLEKPGFNINSACASSSIAVAKGASLIRMGHAECVAVFSLDIVSDFTFSGFSALQAMSPEPAMPFDRNRTGLTLGEGAAVIIMMSEDRMKQVKAEPLAKVSGWGIAGDATHITAPARDARGLKLAISGALEKAGITPERIAAISAHGTGTVYNDLMELTAFASFFSDKVPVNSIKGAIGHTLGAAGGIEVALCVKMLKEQKIPGTVGFSEPEKGGEKRVSPNTKTFDGRCVLTTNSGFGGTNAALVIEKAGV